MSSPFSLRSSVFWATGGRMEWGWTFAPISSGGVTGVTRRRDSCRQHSQKAEDSEPPRLPPWSQDPGITQYVHAAEGTWKLCPLPETTIPTEAHAQVHPGNPALTGLVPCLLPLTPSFREECSAHFLAPSHSLSPVQPLLPPRMLFQKQQTQRTTSPRLGKSPIR